jgi:predicted AAA+ superfamily ATPase
MHLQKEANLYLRGRLIEMEVYPLSFYEFLQFNGLEIEKFKFSDIDRLSPLDVSKIGKKVKPYFEDYMLVGGFPEWFEVKDVRKWFEKITNDIPKRAIYEDVIGLYQIRSPKVLENIFAYIIENQSKILSYETINEVAGLQRSILLNYIDYLKSSYLVIEIQKFAKSVKERIKSKKKYLVLDQGIRNAVLKEYRLSLENLGFIVENIVGVHLYKNGQVFYLRTDGEIDFILSKGKKLIPVEAKYRESPEVPKSLQKFITEKKLKQGLVATKDIFKRDGNICFIPVWLLLLTWFDE